MLLWVLLGLSSIHAKAGPEVAADVTSLLNQERTRRGIAPFVHDEALGDIPLKAQAFKKFLPPSPLSLERQKAESVFKASCQLFRGGCGEKTAASFLAGIDVRFLETRKAPPEEMALALRDATLSRGKAACEPISRVAGAFFNDIFYLALFPATSLPAPPPSPYRPVDFCPDKKVEGMDAYWVPDAFADYRALFNAINLDRTAKDLPPLMFSAPLSQAAQVDPRFLTCRVTADVACMPMEEGRSPLYDSWQFSFPSEAAVPEIMASLASKLVETILLTNSDEARKQWYAIGFSRSDTGTTIRLAASRSLSPDAKRVFKLCRRPDPLRLRRS